MNICYIITDIIDSFKNLSNPNITFRDKIMNVLNITMIIVLLLFSLYCFYNVIAQ